MNKRINLSITDAELEAIKAAIADSAKRGILITPTQAVRSFMWMGIHAFRQQTVHITKKGIQ